WGPALLDSAQNMLFDDGTHGDLHAHDSIYSHTVIYPIGTALGQVFKFGVGGADNEPGKGGYGLNHLANFSDASATYTIASQFGSINPTYFAAWNFDTEMPQTPQGVKTPKNAPFTYALHQNYPNPFNPTTKLQYSIQKGSVVTLKVYNVIGQELVTLVNEKQNAGVHEVTFDASQLSSGIYFYRITADNFVSTKKMTLIK
ncbi:MAG TPA: T9SS type A sorting domain-containing protein, partial [Bacteroidota bacterium]|nr:T9SS type A sorting domain-containing protein [Bacteroidota bacterium]